MIKNLFDLKFLIYFWVKETFKIVDNVQVIWCVLKVTSLRLRMGNGQSRQDDVFFDNNLNIFKNWLPRNL